MASVDRRRLPAHRVAMVRAVVALLAVAGRAARGTGTGAHFTQQQLDAVKQFKGAHNRYLTRNIIVDGPGTGKLSMLTLMIVLVPGGSVKVIDSRGQVHSSDPNDFSAHNHLLSDQDRIFASADLAKDSTHQRLLTVSGHTSPDRTPSVAGGIGAGVVVVGGAVGLVLRGRRRRAKGA